MRRLIAVKLLTSLLAGPALAADHPGKGPPTRNSDGTNVSIQIGGSDRGIIQEYYGQQIAQGHWPARPRQEEQRLPTARPGEEMGLRPALAA